MSIEELLEKYTNEHGFQFGIDIVIKALCGEDILYCLSASNGIFEFVEWNENNNVQMPHSQKIRDEYIRHQTIKEFLAFLKETKNIDLEQEYFKKQLTFI